MGTIYEGRTADNAARIISNVIGIGVLVASIAEHLRVGLEG